MATTDTSLQRGSRAASEGRLARRVLNDVDISPLVARNRDRTPHRSLRLRQRPAVYPSRWHRGFSGLSLGSAGGRVTAVSRRRQSPDQGDESWMSMIVSRRALTDCKKPQVERLQRPGLRVGAVHNTQPGEGQ